ncbi:F0F1 ATP synthase subunit gamma [Sphingobacterium alkalisoli]|uniref:F0F1 ATP synthase subunit gamma n=1 Tax=Sphingobacterium alkalisoli TaxID=1874115 RepID=A0A4U0H599_9SPHI|nr:F0F1 ATP synthase subunit gamma [Sphingobacterium alkalisoli]TJY66766.1 F0F1 ATP synthase subunit gamma [Sphingobacterium alkalisoli]GGH14345.1 F0F1 ATP synthase subunit gamma [Sphingobacterium alkalisoli]
MDTLESILGKLESATDIHSVVKTMKAVAASNIHQYELAVDSLGEYYHTVTLGLAACFRAMEFKAIYNIDLLEKMHEGKIAVIVFGSDQGLVGRFNDSLTDFVVKSLNDMQGNKAIWAVGERIQLLLDDQRLNCNKLFNVPNTVHAIASLVGEVLVKAQQSMEIEGIRSLYIFHNKPETHGGYTPTMQRLLPLDAAWSHTFHRMQWPTKKIPEIVGSSKSTLQALIHEYLFVSLFKACAESLASENTSRLSAMQRAEKNIDELLDDLNQNFHRLRQSAIDEELFDVVAGFEAMNKVPLK